MDKEEIRKLMLVRRKKIKNKEELSTIIVNKIINLDIYQKAKVIAFYKSLKDEVDTNNLINKSLIKKTVLLPKIVDNEMVFIKIDKKTKYVKSNIGVMEPIGNIYNKKIDLIIIPGVSFDENLNRLGFGKGYYDKYLSKNNIFKIGLCFDKQIASKLPINELDIKMDMIVSDKRVLKKV